jgi:hypothetical protein
MMPSGKGHRISNSLFTNGVYLKAPQAFLTDPLQAYLHEVSDVLLVET